MFHKASRISWQFNSLVTLAILLMAGLSIPAAMGQSAPFPTYTVGEQADGSWVVSNGTIITPAGQQVNLGYAVRAKAVAVNPTGNHTAAVLVMGASQAAVEIIDTQTATVIQNYIALGMDPSGSSTGISYSPDGKWLLFSQDGNSNNTGASFLAMAMVGPQGLLEDFAQIPLTYDAKMVNSVYGKVPGLSTVTCFPQSPTGTTGSGPIPCGVPYSTIEWLGYGNTVMSTYPTGIAITPDGKTAYVVLDVNNTLAKIDLTKNPPVEVGDVRVGNLPHSVVLSPFGRTALVSNEGGRIATADDAFQLYSDGTPVVADPKTGTIATGTISVVDLANFKVIETVPTGLHPTGMAFNGKYLLVANAYSDSISVIDMTNNRPAWTIKLGLPIGVAGEGPAFGAGPNSIAVDTASNIAYVALYNANAIAVVNLAEGAKEPVEGLIPVAYAPSSVALDATDKALIVANDKGIGARESLGTYHGVYGYNTHQDNGTVSIIKVPIAAAALATYTAQVTKNNHWDLKANIESASGGSPRQLRL